MLQPIDNFAGPLINGTNKEVLDEIAAHVAEFAKIKQPLYELLGRPHPIPPFGGTSGQVGLGRISALQGSGNSAMYKATSVDGVCPDAVVFGAPANRPFDPADIINATVGDYCLLFLPTGSDSSVVIQLTEKASYSNCASGTGSGLRTPFGGQPGGGMLSQLEHAGLSQAEALDYLLTI